MDLPPDTSKGSDSVRDLLDRLIAFDTTSRLSNRALIDFVADYLASFGVKADILPSDDGTKANLYATIGPEAAGGIILSGHTDVVPVEGQPWTSDPFRVTERDGLLLGRGTADMKGFAACVLAAVPEFVARPLKRPVHIALSYDEEVGCLGVRPMIRHIIDTCPRPALCIVGEPTSMRVVNAHKGIRTLTTRIQGREAHSSQPDLGANAITAAALLIAHLETIRGDMKARGDASGRFHPPFTTLSVGQIEGGTAVNIIARDCRFSWEYRSLPDQDPGEILERFEAFARDTVLPALRETAPDAAIETEDIAHAPALAPLEGSPAEALALYLAEQNSVEAVSYGTEAGLFQADDIPTVVCGPGDIAQAHKPDEFVSIAQLEACSRFLQRLVAHCRDAGVS
ncbi:MAG: acetylornithine deacetylase [Alphaproteobacteria bacterium]